MEKVKPYIKIFLVLGTISLCFLLLINFYNQNKLDTLEQLEQVKAENKKLQEEIETLKSQNDYLASIPSEFKKQNGYFIWPELDKKASKMVQESDGNFKKSWALYLAREGKRYNIDPFLVYELLKVETGGTFNPKLVGPETKYGHAYGLAQFMQNTAPWIADMAGLPYDEKLLFDPYYSMQLSFTYLDFLHNQYGNWDEALTAYHRGMGGLEQYKAQNGHAKSWYAVKIQKNAQSHQALALAQ